MNQFETFELLKVKKNKKIMFGLFNKFTSGTPEIRQQKVTTKRNVNRTTGTRFHQRRNPVWVQYVLEEGRFRGSNTWPQAGRQRREVTQRTGRIQYVQGPWVPYTANRSQLPFSIPQAERSKEKAHMARKGNPISVRLDLNRSSDSSRFSEGDRESHRMGQSFSSVCLIFKIKKAWEDVADVRPGHDFF